MNVHSSREPSFRFYPEHQKSSSGHLDKIKDIKIGANAVKLLCRLLLLNGAKYRVSKRFWRQSVTSTSTVSIFILRKLSPLLKGWKQYLLIMKHLLGGHRELLLVTLVRFHYSFRWTDLKQKRMFPKNSHGWLPILFITYSVFLLKDWYSLISGYPSK